MKVFNRNAIALCLSLAILFLTIGSAAAGDVVEVRGPVIDGENIDDIIGGGVTIDATQFAGFYYNIDDVVTTETLTLK